MGKKQICYFLFEKNGWKGSFKTLTLHWKEKQEFTGLTLSNGEIEVTIEKGKIDRSLLDILIHPFDPIKISLEFGVINSEKKSFVYEILSLLHFSLDVDARAPIQFNKVDLVFHEGVYTYPKTNFLVAGKYPFVTWGSIDLKNETMEIELGPTAGFFKSIFKIQNLPADFVLPFRISGPFGHAHVYTEKAFETLTKIILRQKILELNKHPE